MTSDEYEWTADDVELLISASKSLSASSGARSSFDDARLLLSRPRFLNNLILEIRDRQQDVESSPSGGSGRPGTSERWKRIIGELRWLLSRSLTYTFNSNSETEASLYFSVDSSQHRDDGRAAVPGDVTVKEMVKWFPQLTIEQTRKHVNSATFLVGTLSPKSDADVEVDEHNRVTKWRAFNDRRTLSLSPVDRDTRGSELVSLSAERDFPKRYGLAFDASEKNMYGIAESSGLILRDVSATVVVTTTFLVGQLPDGGARGLDGGARAMRGNRDGVGGEGEEQFIFNDYRYSTRQKNPHRMRALSIETVDEDAFDLYLYGTTSTTRDAEKNPRVKIATGLKTSWFYTVQIKWSARGPDGSGGGSSFYLVRENDEVVAKKFFASPPLKDVATPALYLGGLNAARTDMGTVKSKCFGGVVSNMEILKTNRSHVPDALLRFVADSQIITNDEVTA